MRRIGWICRGGRSMGGVVRNLSSAVLLMGSLTDAADAPRLTPQRQGGDVVLFDAGRNNPTTIQNYTARWKAGSDLVPVARAVTKDGEAWVEFAFRGTNGMACSTAFFAQMPPPDPGMLYRGICLTIDCDRDDYPHIGVNVNFSDKSQLSHDLALDRGRHEYLVESGFRREKQPPNWALLSHVMLTLDTSRQTSDVSYRLRRMTLRQIKGEAGGGIARERVADRFAECLLSPRPKRVEWKEGAFSARRSWPLYLEAGRTDRTWRTAEIFSDRYGGHTGRWPKLRTFEGAAPDAGIILRLAPKGGEAVRHPQGYALSVVPGGVTITGNDEPGLYYGTITFLQLLKHAVKKGSRDLPVPCAEITDWPDTPNRLIRLEHPHTFRNYPVRENRGIDYLIDWTDRFVAGNKFNTFYIDLSANVRYERRPEFNGSEKIYSLEDLRRFGAFCRDHFIDLCPAWQIGGHANWWLTIGYHPELREKGWPSQGDVTHPDHDAIVRDCMLDVIEALRPKYLSPKSDEWWHERKEGEPPDALLHGKTRAQAYLDFHVRLNDWLRARGITMMMFEDMLSPYHNGKRFDTYRIIDAFPKDIILTLWSSGNIDREIRYFTGRGFRIWPNATGMFTLGDDARGRVMGFGKGMYSFGDDRSNLLDEYSPLWSMSNLLRVGDYAWNLDQGEDPEPARLVAIQHLLAVRPNPRAGDRIVPIDIGPALTHRFEAFLNDVKLGSGTPEAKREALPAGEREIGFIPMRLADRGTGDCAILRKGGAPVALPVHGRFSSLIFLHSAFVNDPKDKNVAGVRVRDWMYGWPCGNYVVHYADGTRCALPVRMTDNIKRLDTAGATRASLSCRYAWTIDGAGGEPVHLFQWEWVNPEPDREIARVVAEHDNILDVSLLLFAISGRSVGAAPER